MSRKNVPNHSVARRVAMASMTVMAASGIGLVAAPMAFGQIIIPIGGPILGGSSQEAGVVNSGGASANTGGNTAVGNATTNSATVTSGAGTGGSLIPVEVGLDAPTNSSQGTAAVTSGPATAVGNSADSTVGQSNASGNQVNSFLSRQSQGAGVTNSGGASANTGGNNAIGNASQNPQTVNDVNGGLIGVGISLGGPTNNSTGSATINSGAANAVGNSSSTNVGQASSGGGGGPGGLVRPGVGAVGGIGGAGIGPGPCSAGRFGTFQSVTVRNQGEAEANTGNNVAIGNASTNSSTANVAGSGQTVSGSLVAVGLTIGGPVNNSSGSAVINTGPASAVGNDSVTTVGQSQGSCPQVTTLSGGGRPGVFVPAAQVKATTLARTGLDTGDLGMIAGALLGGGMLLVASQRRRMAARTAAVPMAGFGLGLGGDDWDRAVR
jgi:hypothetical protein